MIKKIAKKVDLTTIALAAAELGFLLYVLATFWR